MKSALVFFFIWSLISLILCSEVVNQTESLPPTTIEDPFEIPDSCLGGVKNFGYKYLTMKIPADRLIANDFGLKMKKLVYFLTSKVWKLENLYATKYLVRFYNELFQRFDEFKCQSLRRAMIYGLITNLMDHCKQKLKESRFWVDRAFVIVDSLEIVDELIPENYMEGKDFEESAQFTTDMYSFIAFAWTVDFDHLYYFLKKLNYSTLQPLTLLISKKKYMSAIKMIHSKESSINPTINFAAWFAVIEADDTDGKLNFILGLLYSEVLDINWNSGGLDFLQFAILSEKNLLRTIDTILFFTEDKPRNLTWFHAIKLNHSVRFYLKYAQSESVTSRHTPEYQEQLIGCIRKFVKVKSNKTKKISFIKL